MNTVGNIILGKCSSFHSKGDLSIERQVHTFYYNEVHKKLYNTIHLQTWRPLGMEIERNINILKYSIMERLKNRTTGSQSKNKIATAINLYEQYIDEEIKTINICTSTRYLINDKWSVDISANKVTRSYPDS